MVAPAWLAFLPDDINLVQYEGPLDHNLLRVRLTGRKRVGAKKKTGGGDTFGKVVKRCHVGKMHTGIMEESSWLPYITPEYESIPTVGHDTVEAEASWLF